MVHDLLFVGHTVSGEQDIGPNCTHYARTKSLIVVLSSFNGVLWLVQQSVKMS